VQRRADIQANAQAVKLSHCDVFQAASHELFARAEDFRSNEPRDIIQVNPRVGLVPGCVLRLRDPFAQRPGKAVLAGFMNEHVETVTMAVGEIRSLSGFKIQGVSSAARVRVSLQFVNTDVERFIGFVTPRDALKPQLGRTRPSAFDFCLNVDVREHAVGHPVIDAECRQQVLQRSFDGRDRSRIAGDGIGSQQHITHRVRPAIEDLPADVIRIVGRRIGLQSGAKVAFGTDLTAR